MKSIIKKLLPISFSFLLLMTFLPITAKADTVYDKPISISIGKFIAGDIGLRNVDLGDDNLKLNGSNFYEADAQGNLINPPITAYPGNELSVSKHYRIRLTLITKDGSLFKNSGNGSSYASTAKIGDFATTADTAVYTDGPAEYELLNMDTDKLLLWTEVFTPEEHTHNLKEVQNSCTEPQLPVHYKCDGCERYYEKSDCTQEIWDYAAWKTTKATPAPGHKWVHKKTAAGNCKNGSEYDECSVCHAKKNQKTISGYSTSYVKSFKLAAGKKSFTAKWAKQSSKNQKKFTGYQIQYSLKSSMSSPKYATAKKSASYKKIGKLKAKKRYYVRVRTYRTVSGKKYYSKWSTKKYIKTK